MFEAIRNFFDKKIAKREGDDHDNSALDKLDLCSAALMIEVMNSDHELDEREHREFIAVLKQSYNIAEEDLAELTKLAKSEAREATSLYQFTRLINDNYDHSQKVALIENMWRIAFSDEKLNKYEDHLIRQIAELIYVSHSDFIRTKLKVRNA